MKSEIERGSSARLLLLVSVAACATANVASKSSDAPARIPFDTATAVSSTLPVHSASGTPKPMGSGKIDAKSKPRVVAKEPAKQVRPVSSGEQLTASATIGAPNSEAAQVAAVDAFNDGSIYLGRHEWVKAEESFRAAIAFDGSKARYHASLGKLMMTQHRWLDAQAAYSAAVLLDLDNKDYQTQLKIARSK